MCSCNISNKPLAKEHRLVFIELLLVVLTSKLEIDYGRIEVRTDTINYFLKLQSPDQKALIESCFVNCSIFVLFLKNSILL